ncbi:RNA chaperone Hfq (plasmid) [Paraburkholderia sp. FT54]|uniref:RNA chaperone Hfq n=1 Tax=Paraburkholderia sp. FT54 TaxID=3074437 RepID=UPI002877B3EA|nr:RNA chaperone Hfq [Paraburkholderia sp. FT54]WNC95519.1 RNA chaperone Hfq [Paraburkholderia sp. FT54]
MRHAGVPARRTFPWPPRALQRQNVKLGAPAENDEFRQALHKGETPANVYLINGIRPSGQDASFDTYIVILEDLSGPRWCSSTQSP